MGRFYTSHKRPLVIAPLIITNPTINRMGKYQEKIFCERHCARVSMRLYTTDNDSNSSDRESSTSPIVEAATDDDQRCESHLLPRLYVGLHQESALPLSEYLQQKTSSSSSFPQRSSLQEGTIVPLSPTQAHYVMRVMRMFRKTGRWKFQGNEPCIRLFDGNDDDGDEWVAQLELLEDGSDNDGQNKKRKRPRKQDKNNDSGESSATIVAHCLAKVYPPTNDNTPPTFQSWYPVLCFAPPKKKERVQWILEKATELGMAAWMPLQTDRVEASSIDSIVWEQKGTAYVREAAEQCERGTVPPLLSLVLEDVEMTSDESLSAKTTDSMKLMQNGGNYQEMHLNQLSVLLGMVESKNGKTILDNRDDGSNSVSILVCRERSANNCAPILEALQKNILDSSVPKQSGHVCLVLVGPEGGWSPAEEAHFDKLAKEYPKMFQNISLGSNVLRTDTAAVTAMAAFSLLQ